MAFSTAKAVARLLALLPWVPLFFQVFTWKGQADVGHAVGLHYYRPLCLGNSPSS